MKKKLTAADMHDPQVIAETPWFSMRKVGIDVAPGERRDFYSIHYPRPAVGIVAIQDEKVLLIRHYRYLIDKVVWAIPSGGVDEEEDPAVAALRELREETSSARVGQSAKGGVSSTSQLPARSVPLRAAMAATSNPRRASKKACITSRPSSVFSAPGATQGAEPGSGPTHRPSPPSLSRSACACCSVQLSSPLSTSRRRIPSRAICAVRLSSASITGDDYSALPKVLHCAGSPLSKPRLNQV